MPPILELKNWQLFWIWIGPQLLLGTFSTLVLSGSGYAYFGLTLLLFIFSFLVFTGILIQWFYKIGTVLYTYLPRGISMPVNRFKIFMTVAVGYIVYVILSIFRGVLSVYSEAEYPSTLGTGLLIGAHLFAMFCMFYCIYFNARILKTVELKRAVTFRDFRTDFFRIWFFPIGIWNIQPRLNKIVAEPAAGKPDMDIFI
jgi:hypothetical protein